MDSYDQLEMLLELTRTLGIEVRKVSGGENDHPGGAIVRLRGRQMIFLDPLATVADQMAVVATALRQRSELEDMYLPPQLRELIEADI